MTPDRSTKRLKSSSPGSFEGAFFLGDMILVGQSLCKGPADKVLLFLNDTSEQMDIVITDNSSALRVIKRKDGTTIARIANSSENVNVNSLISLFSKSLITISSVFLIEIPKTFFVMQDLYFSLQIHLTPKAFDFDPDTLTMLALRNIFDSFGVLSPTKNFSSSSSQSPLGSPDELSVEQLNFLYAKSEFNSKLEGTKMNEGNFVFGFELKEYQKIALTWLIQRENGSNNVLTESMDPMWEDLILPVRNDLHSQEVIYRNVVTGQLSTDFPYATTVFRGGILADEMGLGKTIEILSLIVHSLNDDSKQYRPSLIITPMSLISQWKSEALKAGIPNHKIVLYYGTERKECLELIESSAVVFTTYGTLISDFNPNMSSTDDDTDSNSLQTITEVAPRFSTNSLFDILFERIVLDEGHVIKNDKSITAKAVTSLKGLARWVVTGTPIQNKLEDLYSIIKFLHYEPWCRRKDWNTFISEPFKKKDVRVVDSVQTILQPIILRRTRDMKDSEGKSILSLPERKIEIKFVNMSNLERQLYDTIYQRSKEDFTSILQSGNPSSSYVHIFQLITRIRQLCDHPSLPLRNRKLLNQDGEEGKDSINDIQSILVSFIRKHEKSMAPAFAHKLSVELSQESLRNQDCPICFEDDLEIPLMLSCGHIVCKPCLEDFIDRFSIQCCPTCRHQFSSSNNYIQLTTAKTTNITHSEYASSKIKALQQLLSNIPRDEKIIIFSQWSSMLDIIESNCREWEYSFVRLDGTTNQSARQSVISSFSNMSQILIASLRVGGVGLNLTVANHVILFDPWWNWAIENQAIDRCYRMGQTKPVFVTRLIIKESIEERMLLLQERKKYLIQSVFDIDKDDDNGGKAASLQDFEMLFGS